METLTIKKPQQHSFMAVAVCSEMIPDGVKDLKCLDDGENKYKIHSYFKYGKDDLFPGGMMLLATGKELTKEQIFGHYMKSEYLYIFIVEKK